MTTAEHILVIILSTTLALFLVLAVSLLIMIIVLVRRIQIIVAKAENLVDAAGDIAQSVRKTIGSISFFHALRGLVGALAKIKGKAAE